MDMKLAARRWLYEHEWDIAATMTFANEITQQQAERTLKRYWNRVDNRLYGNAAKHFNKRCERINIIEGSEFGARYHFHCIVKRPKDRYESDDEFCKFLRQQWRVENSNNYIIDFQSLENEHGWTNYITKRLNRKDCDTIEIYSSHISAAN